MSNKKKHIAPDKRNEKAFVTSTRPDHLEEDDSEEKEEIDAESE